MSIPLQRGSLLVAIILLAFGGVVLTRSAIAAPVAAPLAQSSGANPTVCTWFDCKMGAISDSQDDANRIDPGSG